MSGFPRDGIIAQGSKFDVRALDDGRGREPPSSAGVFVHLGVLVLVALCFGLAAQFLSARPSSSIP